MQFVARDSGVANTIPAHAPITMQAGGNRARFFAPQASKPLDVSSMTTNSESSLDGNSTLSSSCSKESPSIVSSESNNPNNLTYSGALVPFSKRNPSNDTSYSSRSSSDASENDTIAQRTRIIETELVFKTKREGHGRLNVSGLINHVDAKALETEAQSASIKEVAEHEDIATRSPGPQSRSKLITKSIASRYPTPAVPLAPSPPPSQKGSFDLPPSNQLASQTFHFPSHYPSRPDITAEDASTTNQVSTAAQDDLTNTHISSGLSTSCDDSIKSLTTAFNRKHGGGSRKPRFSSPISHNRSRRLNSPHVPSEGDSLIDFPGSHGGHGLRAESRNFSFVRDDRELQPSNCQGSQGYHGAPMHHGAQESNAQRGMKRINASGVGSDAQGGKRARMDTYDEVRDQPSIGRVDNQLVYISNSSCPSTVPHRPRMIHSKLTKERTLCSRNQHRKDANRLRGKILH